MIKKNSSETANQKIEICQKKKITTPSTNIWLLLLQKSEQNGPYQGKTLSVPTAC